jgi:chromosome segregation ATPase
MKRALSITAVTALSLLVFLFVGYGQEEGARAVSELLEQELAAMEATFGGLQALMGELISEIKGNMADIDELDARIEDYKDIVTAVSVEIKEAEGKIVGLREDVDSLAATQQELMVRVVALEAGLSELSAFVDELKAMLDLDIADLAELRVEFDALADAFAAHMLEFEAFKVAVYGDIDALRDSVTADISMLQGQFGDIAVRIQALEDEDVGTFKKKVIELERSMAALAIRIDNNRAKLEGFDHAIAGLSEQINVELQDWSASRALEMDELGQRVAALEDNNDIQTQIDTLFFISIVALLAGVGALIWGFLGNG